jgi:hypothetical protein
MLLLPETVAHQDGKGPAIALDSSGIPMLLTLGITRIIEDECLDVSLWGSADREHWRRLAAFPQKFYCGDYPLSLDLSRHPDVQFVRADWKMCSRSPDGRKPLFGFHLTAERALAQHAGAS